MRDEVSHVTESVVVLSILAPKHIIHIPFVGIVSISTGAFPPWWKSDPSSVSRTKSITYENRTPLLFDLRKYLIYERERQGLRNSTMKLHRNLHP